LAADLCGEKGVPFQYTLKKKGGWVEAEVNGSRTQRPERYGEVGKY